MPAFRFDAFKLTLLSIFVAVWCWAAWKPLHPDDWLLENYLVFFWVPVLLLTARFFPVDITFSFSSIYEIIEWRAAALAAPELGLAFLGTQGDIWDAQKDMLLAGTGAIIAMLAVAIWNFWRRAARRETS